MNVTCAKGVRLVARETEREDMWDTVAAATFLRMPEKTLKAWRSKDYGPPYSKVGKHVRYEPETVRKWVRSLTVTPSSD